MSENKFSPLHFPKPTIYDCNSLTSVASQLLRPFDSEVAGIKMVESVPLLVMGAILIPVRAVEMLR